MTHVDSQSNLVAELADEFVVRFRRGERPPISEYVRRYPEAEDEIREVLSALAHVERLAPSLHDDVAAPDVHTFDLPHPEQLGDFRIVREIGRGGMGVVYEAEQISLGRHVALKVLPKQTLLDSKHRKRFIREAKAAARLHHTNIVPVFGVGEQDDVHYYAMQFIHGLGLDEVLVELKRLREKSIADRGPGQATRAEGKGAVIREAERDLAAAVQVRAAACRQQPEGRTPTQKDVSAEAVAQSLLSGQFDRALLVDSDSAESGQPPAFRSQQTETGAIGPSTLAPHDTAVGQLSDTCHDSSMFAFLGQSEQTGKTHSRNAYWQSVARIGQQVSEALQYAHDQGIVHRDVKPGNLLLDIRGSVWVTDFGLAKAADQQDLTHTGDVLGTLRYISPEQFEGQGDARSDVFSLGLTLYEMLALQTAFDERDQHQLIRQVTTGAPPRLRTLDSHIPRDLQTIVHKAIDRDPAHRYQTAGDLAADLERYLDDQPILARRISWVARLGRWCRRNRAVAALTGSVAALLLAGLVVSSIAAVRFQNLAEERTDETNSAVAARDQELEARREAETQKAVAVGQRNSARLNQYYAEIVSGQADSEGGNIGSLHRKLVGHLPVNGEEDRRGWEWYFLFSQCHPEERTMFHRALSPFASWSPDGEYVAIAGTIWSARSGECVREFSSSRIIRYRVAWSPDGQKCAWGIAADDNGIYIWDRQTDRVRSLRGHKSSVWCVAWSPDGTQLASGSLDKTVKIWDVTRGITVRTLPVDHSVTGVAWSPDGELLAAGVQGLKIWKLSTGELVADREEAGRLVRVSWHPDGGQLAVSTNESWSLLDATDGTVTREQKHTPGRGRDIAWNPRGTRLAVAHGEVVTIWDPDGEQSLATLRGHLRPVNSVAWSPDGARLVTSDTIEEVRIWDWNSPIQPLPIPTGGPLESLAWVTDGQTLVAVSADDHSASFWDATQGNRIKVEQPQVESPVLWSPDRRLLAVRAGTDEDPAIRILDAGTGAVHSIWQGPAQHRLHKSVWSPDTAKLAIETSFEGDINLVFWDVDREQTISSWQKKQEHDGDLLKSIRWADDSARVAVSASGDVGEDGSVNDIHHAHIVDVARGKRILKHKLGAFRHRGDVTALAWNPGGDQLACGGLQGRVEILDVDSGGMRFSAKPHNAHIQSLAWSPDGRRLASASQDGTVKVVAAQDGAELLKFNFEEDLPTQLTWSPNGRRLAVATEGGTIHVWDASRGYEFSVNGSRRSELARVYYQRGSSNGPRADDHALREFLRLAPEALGFWQSRGEANAMLGEFDRAAQEFAKAIGPDVRLFFKPAYFRALALLGAGNRDVYQEFCASLVKELVDSPVPGNKKLVAWLSVLSPNPLVDSAEVLRMARASHDDPNHINHDQVLTIGASLVRDGQSAAAVGTLTTLADKLNRGGDATDRYQLACAQYFIALARHQLGHNFQARRYLAEATRTSEEFQRLTPISRSRRWGSTVVLDALRRETEAALREH